MDVGLRRKQWIMYLHADDKWICSYIHLLIYTFELQFGFILHFWFQNTFLFYLQLYNYFFILNYNTCWVVFHCDNSNFQTIFPNSAQFYFPLFHICPSHFCVCTIPLFLSLSFLLCPLSFSLLLVCEDEQKKQEASVNTLQNFCKVLPSIKETSAEETAPCFRQSKSHASTTIRGLVNVTVDK